MIPFFAMSVRVSDAAYRYLFCLDGTVVIILLFVAFAFIRKSAPIAWLGVILGFMSGMLQGTWSAFFPAPVNRNTFLGDPDLLTWQAYFRVTSIAWLVSLIAGFIVFLRLRPKEPSFPAPSPPL